MTDEINDQEIQIKNYKVLRCDSNSNHTGGVIIYIRNEWTIEHTACDKIDRMVWLIEAKVSHKSNILSLIVLYRSPNAQFSPPYLFCDFFNNKMDEYVNKNNVLIMGDFNINYMDNNSTTQNIKQIINDNSFKQIVSEPTRVTETTATLIDYVVTNVPVASAKIDCDLKISDHESIVIAVKAQENQPLNDFKRIKKFKFNQQMFCDGIQNSGICDIVEKDTCDEKAVIFSSNVERILDKMNYTKTVKINSHCDKWFNSSLKQMKQTKINLYKRTKWSNDQNDWTEYKNCRNNFTKSIISAKITILKAE